MNSVEYGNTKNIIISLFKISIPHYKSVGKILVIKKKSLWKELIYK